MKRRLLLPLIAFALTTIVRANPVPDEVAEHFRSLVRATAVGPCPDREHLVRDFGRFGLALITDDDRAAIGDQFDRFAPILIDAQRPPHRLHHDVEVLFLTIADDAQRSDYRDALLEWLTASIDRAPPDGSMIIEYEGDALRRVIARHRARAAEMLADFGDSRAVPHIDDLLGRPELDGDTHMSLERSRRRLVDPCAGPIRTGVGHGVAVCFEPDDIHRGRVDVTDLDRDAIGVVVSLLAESRPVWRYGMACCRGTIQLTLDDGTLIELRFGRNRGEFYLRDYDSLSPHRRWHFESTALWDWYHTASGRQR